MPTIEFETVREILRIALAQFKEDLPTGRGQLNATEILIWDFQAGADHQFVGHTKLGSVSTVPFSDPSIEQKFTTIVPACVIAPTAITTSNAEARVEVTFYRNGLFAVKQIGGFAQPSINPGETSS